MASWKSYHKVESSAVPRALDGSWKMQTECQPKDLAMGVSR